MNDEHGGGLWRRLAGARRRRTGGMARRLGEAVNISGAWAA